jgi:Zn-finger nucleic acid-binding protein
VRDDFATCPDCDVALDPYGTRLTCARCHGTLVSEAELVELLRTFDADHPRAIRWPVVERRSDRRCPRCPAMMDGMRMEGIVVERCPAHGVWFDHGELARVLAPDADEEEFAREYQRRQSAADQFELGTFGVAARDIYRGMRKKP